MKKLLLSAVLIALVGLTATAQSRFGIIAGPSFGKFKAKSSGLTISGSSLTSFHAGFLMDAALTENIYFQPQLLLSGKGGKMEITNTVEATLNPFFVEVPLNFLYKAPAGSGKVFAGLGPYVGVGIFGKSKGESDGTSVSENIQFGSEDDDDMKRFDYGANFVAGYEFANGLLINVNYSLGLADLSPATDGGDASFKLQYFGISLGYLFGGGAFSY